VKIEIDLDNLGFSYDENGDHGRIRTIQEAIVVAAAQQIIGTSGWEYRTELSRVVQEEARKAVAARLDEALQGNIQRSTEWGEPIGNPTTLLGIVRYELGKFLDGKAVRDSFESNGRSDPQNLAEMIRRETTVIMRKDLAAEIRKVRQEVVDLLRTKVLAAAGDALVSGK
jgi:hypothetical protein